MNKVSVIIPVYNSEAYLNTMAKCLKEQTYEDLDIIFVNDGSTDKSCDILKKIKSDDSRVKVYTQNNQGVSAARNKGIELADGEYIAFIDADDKISNDYFEVLVNCMETNNADIVCCGIEEVLLDENNEPVKTKCLTYKDECIESFDDYLKDGTYYFVVWSKLFRSELIKNLRFEPIRYGEDSMFMAKTFSLNPKTCLTSYVGYTYYRWQQSATKNKKITEKDLEANQTWLDIIKNYLYPNASFKAMPWIYEKYMMYSCAVIVRLVKYKKREEYYALRNDEFYNKISKMRYTISPKTKIISTLFKTCPHFLWIILTITYKLRSR